MGLGVGLGVGVRVGDRVRVGAAAMGLAALRRSRGAAPDGWRSRRPRTGRRSWPRAVGSPAGGDGGGGGGGGGGNGSDGGGGLPVGQYGAGLRPTTPPSQLVDGVWEKVG